MKDTNPTEDTEMRAENVIEMNIAAMVHELTNRSSTTLIERQGNDLVIKMTNGEEIVVESFFIAFNETQFHEMQAGIYGEDNADAVDVVEVDPTDAADDADDAQDHMPDAPAGDASPLLVAGGAMAVVAALAGGGGGSDDDDDDDASASTASSSATVQMASLDQPDDEDADETDETASEEAAKIETSDDVEAVSDEEMSQEEFAALFEADGVNVEGAPATDLGEAADGTYYADAMAQDETWDDAGQADVIL